MSFIAIGCSHSPTNSDLSDPTDLNNLLSKNADFINPPLNDYLEEDLTSATDNHLIWQHIENELALANLYNHPRVIQQKDKFLSQNNYLAKVTERSEPFIYFVLSEVVDRQMPAELAILPIVESGYHPRARSHARAEGLWQIMPFTANDLGLKRTVGYDGRHDVHASTSAALDYLSQMHNLFDGDWLLALAAYNAGPQRVKRALRKVSTNEHGTYDKDIYWDLHLPRETLNYVPKILALSSIINDRDINRTPLHPVENKPYLASIQLSKRISPAKLIQAAAANESEIKLLNPAIRNLNTPIAAGYNLLVPKRDAEFLALAIDNMKEAPQPKWAKHKINRGESLGGIALRYGTTVNALRESNNLRNNNIVAGRTLTVPLQTTEISNLSYTKNSSTTASLSNSTETIDTPYMYVVALGDSFWKIANQNNTTVKRLFELNDRNANQPLQPGETILVD
ncbi:MAG: transglycosylase SLT domain-containing protein [Gammaproteobacteria bacterium]